jgi:hypothetical protein
MTKSFKKFREQSCDEEWTEDNEAYYGKKRKLETRRQQRRDKFESRNSVLDENPED